ncbi:MAG: Nramp family divalent metal transporter [Pseudomonadota bacterium]|nr:Nramp family divalent metal transporter [Pseudomonadota bacterium]
MGLQDKPDSLAQQESVLDKAHIGHIRGALGTIAEGDIHPRKTWWSRIKTLLAILGPGLIVMVGDNDAGGFSIYAQAGQNYGTALLWTLLLLIPVLYINQEMVLRLGAVTRVGHARLILERFGRFWGAFSVIDLLLLNALTIITEFIGITLGMQFLGVPRLGGIIAAAVLVMLAASTGDFRRFERFSMVLVLFSLLLLPVFFLVHPPLNQIAQGLFLPHLPSHGNLGDIMLLIIGIVGTTVAPWQLFFQQSYVIDKRITPRFIRYERADLWLGILLVIISAIAIISLSSEVFAGHAEAGHFTDTGAVAAGLAHYHSPIAGILFAIALIDASLIGASAVSLSTAYALADILSLKHSLHRKPADALAFYGIYFVLIAGSAALVLIPGVPLGLLTNAVQALAGILLPSATVFLLLLCNDPAILGPWINSHRTNLITSIIIVVLVMLSIILTASVLWPGLPGRLIIDILIGGGLIGLTTVIALHVIRLRQEAEENPPAQPPIQTNEKQPYNWTMPALSELPPAKISGTSKTWMAILRLYLIVAIGMVIYMVIKKALG